MAHSPFSYGAQYGPLIVKLQCPVWPTYRSAIVPSMAHSPLSIGAQYGPLSVQLWCPVWPTHFSAMVPSMAHSPFSNGAQYGPLTSQQWCTVWPLTVQLWCTVWPLTVQLWCPVWRTYHPAVALSMAHLPSSCGAQYGPLTSQRWCPVWPTLRSSYTSPGWHSHPLTMTSGSSYQCGMTTLQTWEHIVVHQRGSTLYLSHTLS